MTGPQPAPHPLGHGFLQAWVTNAMVWSTTTKRLINATDTGEVMLSVVALYLCLDDICLLIGADRRRADVPRDPLCRADCPIDSRNLLKLRDRLRRLRDGVLHFTDRADGGFEMVWTADEPGFEFKGKGTAGRRSKGTEEDSFTRPEVEALMKDLDPWLHDHWERLVLKTVPVDLVALGVKIDTVMRAAGATLVDTETNEAD